MGRVKSSDGRAPKFAATLPLLLTPLLTPLPAFTEAAAYMTVYLVNSLPLPKTPYMHPIYVSGQP